MEHIEKFLAGDNAHIYEYLGSHSNSGTTTFRVWAPNAKRVSVAGDFNGWNPDLNEMHSIDGGIWEASVDGLSRYDNYNMS